MLVIKGRRGFSETPTVRHAFVAVSSLHRKSAIGRTGDCFEPVKTWKVCQLTVLTTGSVAVRALVS